MVAAFLPFSPRLLRQPEDARNGLGVADFALEDHLLRRSKRKEVDFDLLVRLGLRQSRFQISREVDGHGFVEEPRANVEMQDLLPASSRVSGLLQ